MYTRKKSCDNFSCVPIGHREASRTRFVLFFFWSMAHAPWIPYIFLLKHIYICIRRRKKKKFARCFEIFNFPIHWSGYLIYFSFYGCGCLYEVIKNRKTRKSRHGIALLRTLECGFGEAIRMNATRIFQWKKERELERKEKTSINGSRSVSGRMYKADGNTSSFNRWIRSLASQPRRIFFRNSQGKYIYIYVIKKRCLDGWWPPHHTCSAHRVHMAYFRINSKKKKKETYLRDRPQFCHYPLLIPFFFFNVETSQERVNRTRNLHPTWRGDSGEAAREGRVGIKVALFRENSRESEMPGIHIFILKNEWMNEFELVLLRGKGYRKQRATARARAMRSFSSAMLTNSEFWVVHTYYPTVHLNPQKSYVFVFVFVCFFFLQQKPKTRRGSLKVRRLPLCMATRISGLSVSRTPTGPPMTRKV